ncbi:MAG: SdiA-regulated domain-containing protein, partial [Lewinella sp.]
FDRPDIVVDLPKDLKEISGLAPWRTNDEVLAVQDEDGILFVLNTNTGKVQQKISFGKDRDYEGVARSGNNIYVLERDGDIHHTTYSDGEKDFKAEKLETSFSYRNDTEGIGFDPVSGYLLIVPKEQELNPTDEEKYRHGIYGFSLANSTLAPQPLFYVDELEVGGAIYGKTARYSFKPSGVAVDPITKDIYVLASVGKILIVIGRESEIKHIELLKEKVFRQPEGIAFNENGDLFLSSEGKSKKGIVATFKRNTTQLKGKKE